MILLKSHGLGNDYLVVVESSFSLSPARIRLLCHRHLGVGSDGLLLPVPSSRATSGLRIFNPDGSEAEKSGNGIRIFARFLHDHRQAGDAFHVEVGGELVHCAVEDHQIRVALGYASFDPPSIPFAAPSGDPIHQPLPAELVTSALPPLHFTAVGLGNPHCVLFHDDLDTLPWRELGAALERHPFFPRRTNVQFARVLSPHRVEIRIWERGAGETLASGSSACAAVAAGQRTGLLDATQEVEVDMPGGRLHVHLDPDGRVHLRGPVREIAHIRLSPHMEARLAAL